MVTERRILAAKPARVRRDIAGFGPIRHGNRNGVPAEPPTVRIILIPAADPDHHKRRDSDDRSRDWREW